MPRRAMTAGLALLAVAGVALLVASPWKDGPSVIASARAALAAPAGRVVYEEVRFPATGRLCLSPRQPSSKLPCPFSTVVRTQLWVERRRPTSTFRAVTTLELPQQAAGAKPLPLAPFGNALISPRSRNLVLETGGTLGPQHLEEVLFHQRGVPVLTRFTQAPTAIASVSFDPARVVQDALQSGHARLLGPAVVRGRRIERIAVSLRNADGARNSAIYEVDGRTFAPVEIVFEHGGPGYPFVAPFGTIAGRVTLSFTAYRSLPATAANLALTSIRAQNPHARIVCGQEFGLPDC